MVRKYSKNDEGVSAVIGVILMVAITVILAAVIAAFVFSMSNGVSKPYTVGITIKKTTSGAVSIVNSGGPDVGQLEHVYVTYQPVNGAAINAYNGEVPADGPDTDTLFDYIEKFDALKTVGGSFTIPAEGVGSPNKVPPTTPTHVIVTGYFKDGKQQVIGEADV
ncbi:type IV pilin [Methanocella arvoryzae]|uniref:Archaeal Type IV pilin N-terminal domain-containing protein n=1 Tax=Methanocella arvoryzae (strain DSM 22066 / NBRC 105507 / MRE50) TaxID=351160 RepID=Q0W8V6_METAR|nr:type IV pilin N-terminal domain-containing protein [Methanocella arvoryzae]CAJ35187.1 hypothetical protein LRC184 [Methanocella arvoryzae MRE50]